MRRGRPRVSSTTERWRPRWYECAKPPRAACDRRYIAKRPCAANPADRLATVTIVRVPIAGNDGGGGVKSRRRPQDQKLKLTVARTLRPFLSTPRGSRWVERKSAV